MNATISSQTFECVDILMAAFLLARGHRMTEIRQNPSRPDRSIFMFERVASTESDAREFVEDGLVPVRSLARHLSRLRNHVRNERHATNARNGNDGSFRS